MYDETSELWVSFFFDLLVCLFAFRPVSPLRGKLLPSLWGRLQVYSAHASHSANKSSAFDLSFCAAESQIRPFSKFAKACFRKQLHFTARQQLSTPFPDSDVKAELRF
jgi:hypothetical protein